MSSLNDSIIQSATEIAPLNQILFEYNKPLVTEPGVTSLQTPISDCACYLNTKVSVYAPGSGTVYVDYYHHNKRSSPPFYTDAVPFGSVGAAVQFHFFTFQISSFYVRVRLELDSDPVLAAVANRKLSFFVTNVKH